MHHGLVDGTTREDARRLEGSSAMLDRALAVYGITKSIDDAAKKTGANRDVDNLASAFDGVALLDETIVTEDRDADIVGFHPGRQKRIPPSHPL